MFYFKAFDQWNLVKQSIEKRTSQTPHIRIGEIRWTSIGVNIDSEIDGKGGSFVRPCLIFYVIGAKRALVIPITSKIKNDAGYLSFTLNNRNDTFCINQLRAVSQKRIYNRLGKISDERLSVVRQAVGEYFCI